MRHEVGDIGIALDYSHSKVYARDNTLNHKTPGWTHFEFTDGLNLATANVLYRFKGDRDWTPYIGAGIGANIPRVEVTRVPRSSVAARAIPGATTPHSSTNREMMNGTCGLFRDRQRREISRKVRRMSRGAYSRTRHSGARALARANPESRGVEPPS